jgi:hypothetical protein
MSNDLDFMTYDQRNELFTEDNATKISIREELLGPCLDASQLEDFDNFQDKQVLGYGGEVIGYRSELPKV